MYSMPTAQSQSTPSTTRHEVGNDALLVTYTAPTYLLTGKPSPLVQYHQSCLADDCLVGLYLGCCLS